MAGLNLLSVALSSAYKEAEKALEEGENSRVALAERSKDFPMKYVNIFKVFLNYGPYLFERFITDEIGKKDSYQNLNCPTALDRFFRILIINYHLRLKLGLPELSQKEIKKLDEFVTTIDALYRYWRKHEWFNYNFRSEATFIKRGTELKIYLSELAEYEFLGEHNWGHHAYPPIKHHDSIQIVHSFTDWNLFGCPKKFPNTKIVGLYSNDIDFEYSETRGVYTRPPPLSALRGIYIEIGMKTPEIEEIENNINFAKNRIKYSSNCLNSMEKIDLELFYVKHHLTPLLLLINNLNWMPPPEFIKNITNEVYSEDLYEEYDLYVLKYYKALRMGSEQLLNLVDKYE